MGFEASEVGDKVTDSAPGASWSLGTVSYSVIRIPSRPEFGLAHFTHQKNLRKVQNLLRILFILFIY